ncbi:hypothetical protein PFTANZ_01088, partial [Plasmodium falciparum Tanzania (2000708)]
MYDLYEKQNELINNNFNEKENYLNKMEKRNIKKDSHVMKDEHILSISENSYLLALLNKELQNVIYHILNEVQFCDDDASLLNKEKNEKENEKENKIANTCINYKHNNSHVDDEQNCNSSLYSCVQYVLNKDLFNLYEKYLNGKNEEANKHILYNNCQIDERNNHFLNSVTNKLYKALKEPTFFNSTSFTIKKITKVIEKVLTFLKAARCNKRLKIYIIFELFQNKNIMKYFPSLVNYINSFHFDVSNEEIIKNVINNIYFKEEDESPISSINNNKVEDDCNQDIKIKGDQETNEFIDDEKIKTKRKCSQEKTIQEIKKYKLKKFLHFYAELHKKCNYEEGRGYDIDEQNDYNIDEKDFMNDYNDNNNNNDNLFRRSFVKNEMMSVNHTSDDVYDEKIIRNCLMSSLPSFTLNDEITNLSYNGKYQYYEDYLCSKKKDEEDLNFKYYNMDDVFYKMEYLIHNYFYLKRSDFDNLIDSLFQPYLCRVSSGTNNLINMNNLMNKFLNNGFSNMIFTGAKGSKVNYSMICGMLDQQYLEGKRVPRMRSGKTLPSFHRYDYGARSCGLITDCFLEGLRPQEYFFHCMSGREGLIDTAVKTAKSGYIQRCLIKCMESVILHYDGTVRNEDNSIIQFLYGEDGIDPSKTAYLDLSKDLLHNYHLSFSKYLNNNMHSKILNNQELFLKHEKDNDTKDNEEPLISKYNPYTYIGSVSDKFNNKLNNTLLWNDLNFPEYENVPMNFDTLSSSLLKSKYYNSLCNPGESIGILVAQSFGEPATQMTLNTFHLAGTENVTMGIPRLKEIFLTSKLTSKPMIYVPIKLQVDNLKNDANKMKNYITSIADKILSSYKSIFLTDVIYGIGVDRKIILKENQNEQKHTINLSDIINMNDEELSGDTQLAKINNVLKNCNINFDMKKEWNYEIIIQFENLYHFCNINKHLTISFILYKVVNALLNSVLNKVHETFVFHNLINMNSLNHEYYDELYDFISKK